MSWPAVEVTEVARVVGGATPKSAIEEFWDGDVNWVTPKDLSNLDGKYIAETPRKITAQGLRSCAAELLPANSVLFSSRAPIGHVAINAEPMATNQGFKSFVPGPDLDASFLYWWLDANRGYLQSLGTGATFKEVSKAVVQRIKIPLPPLEEQRRIAGILDQADALRRLRTRALDKLNTLGQAIFHEMFGAALANQFFEFGKAVEEFRYGTSNKSGDGGLPTLRIPNVIGGGIDTGEIKNVEVTGAELNRLRLREGDVLFVRTNGNPDYVGRCASFSQDAVAGYGAETDWIFASYLIRARLSDRINPVFAKTYFASQIGRKAIRERCKTSAGQFNINTEGLSSLPFPDVSREQQDRFAETVLEIEKNSAPMKASAEAMERKFSSLQYSAFRGEL
ncbi:type I restriction enzyme, S subunit [Lutimaribacter pacificus]|uniref:Type I restriction enzyme, S subunit n=1 Tax=Lutimaribacter pacificus TaxID=391948 RepID=A0A1H0GKU8_9RHOB|nr:restriction endonuclease subunit S [Lutimaribacter pacificus]SDO07500.1 type I restriction enzyme, S subunit [Lutimaribacter pacificus]SHJ89150.1 type I restriction enzyme, S subunit [Lutimaribacter pacificus]